MAMPNVQRRRREAPDRDRGPANAASPERHHASNVRSCARYVRLVASPGAGPGSTQLDYNAVNLFPRP